MADFIIAYNKTNKNEGGYSNDPDDRGGETWKGIARNFHPSWGGWSIIDLYKKIPPFPECLNDNKNLENSVKRFYKEMFWDKIKGDKIKSQSIADSLYDSAVNMGHKQAIVLAQRSGGLTETGNVDDVLLNHFNNQA